MATLSIVTYPQKILKRRADLVSPSPDLQKLIPQMVEAMYKNEGIGLAAPQIGISKRVIIVETSQDPRKTVRSASAPRASADKKVRGRPLAFLNPVITKKTGKLISEEEGCLSLPGIFVPVKRKASVEIRCQTPAGKEVKIEAGGLTARIFQHEIDHLLGKLIIDRISPLKRLKLRKQLRALARANTGMNVLPALSLQSIGKILSRQI